MASDRPPAFFQHSWASFTGPSRIFDNPMISLHDATINTWSPSSPSLSPTYNIYWPGNKMPIYICLLLPWDFINLSYHSFHDCLAFMPLNPFSRRLHATAIMPTNDPSHTLSWPRIDLLPSSSTHGLHSRGPLGYSTIL